MAHNVILSMTCAGFIIIIFLMIQHYALAKFCYGWNFQVQIIISKCFESYRDEIALESYDTIVFHL